MFHQILSKVSRCSRLLSGSPLIDGNQGRVFSSLISGTRFSPSLQCSFVHNRYLIKPGFASKYVSTAISITPSLFLRPQPSLLNSFVHPTVQTRSVTKWSLSKGKRSTVKAVILRFKRLNWSGRGIWIRARAGASKKMWKKNRKRKHRAKTHVFCNATQSQMLDKMVTRFWRRNRYYPDDPYRPYMHREGFSLTERYPREYF
ncbi:mitochondrial 54S ribosomal protein YmL35 [Halocaridina rubra]|uniref:Large ribosomal subunit protein bL35m n=1 Tax=Halocaridina rubra TaxID=373956 RepID=A0AAN8XUQ2_HALRR